MDYLENYFQEGIITHSIQKEGKAPIWYKENGTTDSKYKDKKEDIQKRMKTLTFSDYIKFSKLDNETCKGIIIASIFLLLNIDVKSVGAFT